MCFFSSLFSYAWDFSSRHPAIALVFIGVLGEGVEVISKVFFEHWYKKYERPIEIIGAIFWIVVVIGLAFEFSEAATTDRKTSENEVLVANIETTNAQLVAANLAQGEQLMRQNMEFQRLVESSFPRSLDVLREAEFASKLRPFAGTEFFVVTLAEAEPTRVGHSIERLLVEAGWQPEPMVRYADATEQQIPDGIWIESNGPIVGPPPSPLLPAMDALNDVLNESHIMANRSFLNPWLPPNKLPTNTVRIVIGLKPDWYLESKKFQQESEHWRLEKQFQPQAK